MAATDFHGIAIPSGTEQRILYHSSFRAIATYAMSLADLDRELQHVIKARNSVVKEDARRNLCGKRVLLPLLLLFIAHAHAIMQTRRDAQEY